METIDKKRKVCCAKCDKMRILHIFDDYGVPGERALPGKGSVSSIIYYMAKYLAEKGNAITILERDHGILPKEEEINGIRYVRIRAKKLPAAPYKLIKNPIGLAKLLRDGFDVAAKTSRFLKENEFDVVHVHFPFASTILINMNRGLRERIIYTAHIGEEKKRFALDSSAPLALRFFSPDLYLMKRVRKSVVLNEPLKEKLIEKGIEEGKLEVIPNGVNVDDFNLSKEEIERVKEKYGLNETTVMFSGTVTPRKGVEYLVRAAEILKENNVLFLIVGNTNLDREYADKVMEYAKQRNLKVRFTGFVPYEDLKALYSTCDIFVLPSFGEGDPIALKEALASGKPLVGTKVGGIPAQIKDGWNGFLVDPGNEKQLAEKIRYLIDNPEERERMGENSRKLAREEFDWKKIAEKYLEIYEEVVR